MCLCISIEKKEKNESMFVRREKERGKACLAAPHVLRSHKRLDDARGVFRCACIPKRVYRCKLRRECGTGLQSFDMKHDVPSKDMEGDEKKPLRQDSPEKLMRDKIRASCGKRVLKANKAQHFMAR